MRGKAVSARGLHVAEAVRDISGTVNSMTYYGGLSRDHNSQW